MVPERSRTIPEGPESAPEGSGMSRNDPGRSRKVLEDSGRFRKFLGSTTHYPTPLALGASHLGCPGRPRGGGVPRGRNPPPGGKSNSPIWQVSGGKVWEVWESKLDSPPPLLRPKGLLATYIMRGGGGGVAHIKPQGLCATLPLL